MDKVWLNTLEEKTEPPPGSLGKVEQIIHTYYQALDEGNTDMLQDLLHQHWDLKYLRTDGSLHTESRSTYIQSIQKSEPQDQVGQGQLLSMDLYHDGLAIVRVDHPARSVTTYFVLFKVEETWTIASERRGSPIP